MPIDIDRLTEAELIDLNRRIVARLKFLHDMRQHAHMLDFSIGEGVSFQPDSGPLRFGVITKYNRKTVSILTDDAQLWNVAPGFLRKLSDEARHSGQGSSAMRDADVFDVSDTGPEKQSRLD